MYHVLIVEDEVEQAEILCAMLAHHPRSKELSVSCMAEPADLAPYLERNVCNIVLMDISFGDGRPDGIGLVQECFPSGCGMQVIYVTGHLEYCTPVYRTEHVYFLMKPVGQSDLNDALDKALLNLESLDDDVIGVQSGGSVVTLHTQSIGYIESDRRKMLIHVSGCSVIETYATLASMKEMLPPSFVHCHQSFLVNMAHIAEFRKSSIRLQSGEIIPVSQKKRKATHEALMAYLSGEAK